MSKQILKSINGTHRIMMHRLMLGERATDICKDLNMTDATFSVIKNSPLFKAEYDRLTRVAQFKIVQTSQKVSDIINAAAPLAARTLVDMISSEDNKDRLRASEKIIDYSDFGRDRQSEISKPIVINQQQMTLIEEAIDDNRGNGSIKVDSTKEVLDEH